MVCRQGREAGGRTGQGRAGAVQGEVRQGRQAFAALSWACVSSSCASSHNNGEDVLPEGIRRPGSLLSVRSKQCRGLMQVRFDMRA